MAVHEVALKHIKNISPSEHNGSVPRLKWSRRDALPDFVLHSCKILVVAGLGMLPSQNTLLIELANFHYWDDEGFVEPSYCEDQQDFMNQDEGWDVSYRDEY